MKNIQESQKTPSRINLESSTPSYIMKLFPDKQNWEIVASTPALQEILKGVLQAEVEWCWTVAHKCMSTYIGPT